MDPTTAPVAVILEGRIAPGEEAAFHAWCDENLGDTRGWEGCFSCELYTSADDPEAFTILEYWRAQEDHQAYGAWRAGNGSSAAFAALLDGPPSVRYVVRPTA
jgi:quinol monooxygenase YgiN